ncbi:MAG: transcriptional repressor [Acidimicrobiales bacterium]|nr:MAG: transcriptional repressor [Acidimicrobiales bacterium]
MSLFRSRGMKITPQRERIFRVLQDDRTHPTAEAVWEAVRVDMPTVSLRTVYQTLHDLAHMGELNVLDLGTGSMRFDPNVEPHNHLVCESCGSVADVTEDVGPVKLPSRARRGFSVRSVEVVFRGTCEECRPSR